MIPEGLRYHFKHKPIPQIHLQPFRIIQVIALLLVTSGHTLVSQDRPELSVFLIDSALLEKATSVVRSELTTFHISSPRTFSWRTTRTVTIFNDQSPEVNLRVPYDKYIRADIKDVRIYDQLGRLVRKLKKSEITDHASHDGVSLYNDERFLLVQSFGGHLPYTLEYTWETIHDQTYYYPPWMPQDENQSIESAVFILESPEDLEINSKTINSGLEHLDTTNNGVRSQRWEVSHLRAMTEEAWGPPYYERYPMLLLSPSRFEVETYTGSMSDWKSFGAFLYDLNKGRDELSPEMKERIKRMTALSLTPFEKIDTLYHWLQQNLRYVSVQVGIGGWQAFDAAYVEKNRFGDCKALSNFMKAMLREASIEAWEVSIRFDEKDNLFLPDFVYPDFNHVMLYVPGEKLWLECTSNELPTGSIYREEEHKKVLLVTPQGGIMATTPALSAGMNQTVTADTILFAELPLWKGKKTWRGHLQDDIRQSKFYTSTEEQKKSFLEDCPLSIQHLNKFQLYVRPDGSESGIEYEGSLSQFGNLSGNRYFIPIMPLEHRGRNLPTGIRKTDFISKDEVTSIHDLWIAMPDHFSVEFLPPAVAYEFRGYHYQSSIQVENQFIHIHHEETESAVRLTPEEYKDLVQYQHDVMQAKSRMIVLNKV